MVAPRLLLAYIAVVTPTRSCSSELDCSLNGLCEASMCKCDKPWTGPHCGVLKYAVTPAVAKSLYTLNKTHNTWNGPIVLASGKYHIYLPIYGGGYGKPSLYGQTTMLHGLADQIEGPYSWDLPAIGTLSSQNNNPACLVYPGRDGKTKYTLWSQSLLQQADSPFGPFLKLPISGKFGFSNPAPIYHNGTFYMTTDSTNIIWSAPAVTGPWSIYSHIKPNVPIGPGTPYGGLEDPFMWIDRRGHWHIINHALDESQVSNCGTSIVSAHLFSLDGKDWRVLVPAVEPYSHTVHYDDGTSHTYATLERPNLHLNEMGQITHINLAANLLTGDDGCLSRCKPPTRPDRCSCTNCKYTERSGTILIKLDGAPDYSSILV